MLLLSILSICFAVVTANKENKFYRLPSSISNSLVNMGKIDVSFFLNKDAAASMNDPAKFMDSFNINPWMKPPMPAVPADDQCPCTVRDPSFAKSSDMFGKILSANDIFSHNKDPFASSSCCTSHEEIEEETVLFNFNGPNPENHIKHLPILQNVIGSFLPNLPAKPKTIDIYLYPKKMAENVQKKIIIPKRTIHAVGGGDIEIDPPKSVKKDLDSSSKRIEEPRQYIDEIEFHPFPKMFQNIAQPVENFDFINRKPFIPEMFPILPNIAFSENTKKPKFIAPVVKVVENHNNKLEPESPIAEKQSTLKPENPKLENANTVPTNENANIANSNKL